MWMKVFGFLVLLLLVFVFGVAAASDGASDMEGKISGEVFEHYNSSDTVRVVVLLEPCSKTKELMRTGVMSEGTLARQQRLGRVKDVHDLWLINGIAMNATRDAIECIAKDPSVAKVVVDYPVFLNDALAGIEKSTPQEGVITEGLFAINASSVWLNGYTGRGVNVSIVDTGIAKHPDVADRRILWYNFVSDSSADYSDDNGHGTHVAGIVAGNGASGTITGAAPNATLFDAKVFNSLGWGLSSDVVDAFQWSVEHGADIISYSGGGYGQKEYGASDTTIAGGTKSHTCSFTASQYGDSFPLTFIMAECELYNTDAYNATTISLVAPNGSVVSSYPVDWQGEQPTKRMIKYMEDTPLAGGTWNLTVSSTINTSYKYKVNAYYVSDGTSLTDMAAQNAVEAGTLVVVAAGNSGQMGLRTIDAPAASPYSLAVGATRADMDYIADFSSRGPAGFNPSYTKPEVCAPGLNILSLGLSGGYVRKSGTSMATPFVSGIAALMLEANSSLTPYQIRDTLESTAIDLGEHGVDNTYGWGRVDAWRAVNATTPLEPSTSFTSGQLQLFGGSLTDDVLVPFSILDPEGDVVGADVLAAGLDTSSSASTADFSIITKSTPDPSICEYRVYVDADNNTSTGISMRGTGVDYWLVVNSSSNVLFDANGTIIASDVAWEVGDHTLWLKPLRALMGITDIQSPMRFFVQAECEGDVDTAPDTGYGTYPYQIEVGSFAVVWNTSSRVPAPNESVRFELYGWNSAVHAYDISMGSVNTTTNDRGYTNASFVCTSTSTGGDALVRVSVGDISVDDTLMWYATLPAPLPMFTPTLTPSYAVCSDGVLNVSYTLVASDFTPYEHKVALVFGTPVVGYPHVQVNLTPHNGTVSYSLDLNETSLDDDPSFEIYLLNGTVESHDYHVWAGTAVVVEESTRTLSVSPSFSRSQSYDNATFLVLTGRLYDDAPLAREVGVDVYWLSEAEVKQLSTSASSWLYPHLKNTSNLKYPVEHTAVSTSSYGVGTLNLTPPVGAYFGLVVLSDGELEQRAAVLVQDPHLYDHLFTSPALPTIDVSVEWYAEYNGSAWNAEPQLTVSVEMYYLNESTLIKEPVVSEPLHLVLSTGEVEDVLTDTWGRARAVFSAPKLDDIVNTTPTDPEGYVGISSWSVGAVAVSNRADEGGGMLTATAYGPIQVPLSQRRAISEASYTPSTLVANISWEDEGGMHASGVPTVLDVVRKTAARDHVLEVLLSTYINDSGMSHTEGVGVGAFGEYSASATTRENTLRGSTTTSDEDSVSVMPVKVVSDIDKMYPLNGTFDVHVKVSHLNETPISSALVYISQSAGSLQTDPMYHSYVVEPPAWSSLGINYTDASGTAVLQLRTPPQDASVAWVIGASTGEQLFPYARGGTLNASNNTPPVPVLLLNHTVSNVGSATYFDSSLSYDVEGGIVARMWEFGDGISECGVLADHTYTDYIWEGAYQHFGATLTVRDSGGFTNTTYTLVVVYMAGDANGDGVANVLDAALVGLHWNARYGDASYHDGADLNNDDVVNILDAALTGLNWNRNVGGI